MSPIKPEVGYCFHIRVSGEIEYQGYIAEQKEESFVVRYFNWITGTPSDQTKIVHPNEMKDWVFYKTPKEMDAAYVKEYGEK